MISSEIRAKYKPTIGIECHVQLKTKTKLFAAVDNNARDAAPNTLVSPLCFGLPGTLPVLNEAAIRLGIRAGLALNGQIAKRMKFDRKHYFYPDLPKGYQITQYDEPIVGAGFVDVPLKDGSRMRVGIERAHLEEDAGKSTHPSGASYSLVDLNRAGTPLLEIVSKPEIYSAEQAKAYARELYLLMKYADVSDVDLYHGNMRFDVNVSLALVTSDTLGIRSETKNLNSFKSVERAVEYEIERQVELLEKGLEVIQETRGWDDAKQKTVAQRGKEHAHDYRYFPEPDVPPIVIDERTVEAARAQLPPLPGEVRKQLTGLGVAFADVETILDNDHYVKLILEVSQSAKDDVPKVTQWLKVDVQALLAKPGFSGQLSTLTAENLIKLARLVKTSQLSSSAAKEVLKMLLIEDMDPETVAKQHNLLQISNDAEIKKIVQEVLEKNSQAATDLKNGEVKAMSFLVGQVMQASRGQANPQLVSQIIISILDL